MPLKYTLESDVDDYVKASLNALGLVKLKDYNEKSSMSDYMKESLRGSAKTQSKANFGIPDFTVEKYHIPMVYQEKVKKKSKFPSIMYSQQPYRQSVWLNILISTFFRTKKVLMHFLKMQR